MDRASYAHVSGLRSFQWSRSVMRTLPNLAFSPSDVHWKEGEGQHQTHVQTPLPAYPAWARRYSAWNSYGRQENVVLMWRRTFACGSSCTGLCMNSSPVLVVRHDESAKSGRMQQQHSLPFWCSPVTLTHAVAREYDRTHVSSIFLPERFTMDDRRIAAMVWTHVSACSPVHQLTNQRQSGGPAVDGWTGSFTAEGEDSPIQWHVYEIYSRIQLVLASAQPTVFVRRSASWLCLGARTSLKRTPWTNIT